MIPVIDICTPNYKFKRFNKLSGKLHYTEFGTPVAIEYWENRPNFELISKPIINYLRSQFLNKRIGLRMLGSQEHPNKSRDDLIEMICQLGHDRYDLNWSDNKYSKIDHDEMELFLLELEIGKKLGINGEEQVKHALNSFYLYPDEPIRVDIGIVYDLSGIRKKQLKYRGKEEVGHEFINPEKAADSVLSVLKIE